MQRIIKLFGLSLPFLANSMNTLLPMPKNDNPGSEDSNEQMSTTRDALTKLIFHSDSQIVFGGTTAKKAGQPQTMVEASLLTSVRVRWLSL